jgi:hypothetical protein
MRGASGPLPPRRRDTLDLTSGHALTLLIRRFQQPEIMWQLRRMGRCEHGIAGRNSGSYWPRVREALGCPFRVLALASGPENGQLPTPRRSVYRTLREYSIRPLVVPDTDALFDAIDSARRDKTWDNAFVVVWLHGRLPLSPLHP